MKMMAVLLNAGTLLMAGCFSIRPTGEHLSHAEYRSIARGCVHLLRTVRANETFIPISDPRVSSAIRAQGPQAVYICRKHRGPECSCCHCSLRKASGVRSFG